MSWPFIISTLSFYITFSVALKPFEMSLMFAVLYRFRSKQPSEWSRIWLWKLVSMLLAFANKLSLSFLLAPLATILKYIICICFFTLCSKTSALINVSLVAFGILGCLSFFHLDVSHYVHLCCWLCINPTCIDNLGDHFCWCTDDWEVFLSIVYFFVFVVFTGFTIFFPFPPCTSSLLSPFPFLPLHHHCSISTLK